MRPIKLNLDQHPIDLKEGDYSFALNAVLESKGGEQFVFSNERSNSLYATLKEGYQVLGTNNLGNDRLLIFSSDGQSSEIGLLTDTYEELINLECLNFSERIDSIYRVREGCKDTIYFTDGVNPVRVFEIGRQYTTCDEMELFIGFTIPTVTTTVTQAGQLEEGSYHFSFRYVDQSGNPTNWFLDLDQVNIQNEGAADKAISITLEGLDTFPYYQVAITRRIGGNGIIQGTIISPLQTSPVFTFTGDTSGYTEGTIEEILIQKLGIETASHIEQIENRLILADVQEKQIDWCAVQELAYQIEVNYELRPSQGSLTTMGDEVYALAISYVYEDGYFSPFMHIPGREPTAFDKTPLTVVGGLAGQNQINVLEVEHLGLEVGDTVPRWKVENTSTSTQLGYYEATTEYQLGSLAGQKVRHHRMPETTFQEIGLSFSNITYPEGVVGHIIGFKKAGTIVDKGFLAPIWRWETPDLSIADYYIGDVQGNPEGLDPLADALAEDQLVFISSKNLFSGEVQAGSHFKVIGLQTRSGGFQRKTRNVLSGAGSDTFTDLLLRYHYYDYSGLTSQEQLINITDFDRFEIGQQKDEDGLGAIFNRSLTNSFIRYKVNDIPDFEQDGIIYASLKRDSTALDSLDLIEFDYLDNNVQVGDTTIFSGDTYISSISYENIIKESYNRNVFNNLKEIELEGVLLTNLQIESPLDLNKRTQAEECQVYFQPSDTYDPTSEEGFNYLVDKYTGITGEDADITYTGICNQYLAYNNDFTYFKIVSFTALSQRFDCTSQCLNKYPNRVYYSEQSFQEESLDQFRVFRPNNYRDIEAEYGPITNIFRFQNNLYIHTTDALWVLPQNVQERVSVEGIVSYLGSGDFFGLPPRLILDTESGTAGCSDKWSTIKTPQGVFFADSASGEVYILFESLKPLDAGIRNFLEENTGGEFIATYDDRHKRIILTHLDGGCNSWTLSYSFLSQGWTSFHSYIPTWYAFTKSNVFSFQDGIWKHNAEGFTNYYGEQFPHKLEVVFPEKETTIFDSISWWTEARVGRLDDRYSTYSKIILYNSYQCSGEITLNTREHGTNSEYLLLRVLDTPQIERDDRNFYVNSFFNVANGDTYFWDFDCPNYKLTNKTLNQDALGLKDWFLTDPFKDKYLVLRLEYTEAKHLLTFGVEV